MIKSGFVHNLVSGSHGTFGDFVNHKIICWPDLLKVLIEASVDGDECVPMFEK
jgi:hypothetical protein